MSSLIGTGSMHQNGSTLNYPARNGSVMSGSNFQRGGSIRGSDRSIRSHARRDIDDIALSMHHMGGSQHLLHQGASSNGGSTGYGRKEIDDMVRSRSQQLRSQSHFFKRENSLQLEVEQPHGIMILDGDGLMLKNNKTCDLRNPNLPSKNSNSTLNTRCQVI